MYVSCLTSITAEPYNTYGIMEYNVEYIVGKCGLIVSDYTIYHASCYEEVGRLAQP